MKITRLILALCFFTTTAFAQTKTDSKLDARFGIGTSLLGTGDMRTIALENELNYKLTKYLSTSASIGYAKSYTGVSDIASYLQGNINVFVSPFKNSRKNDFRIGGGLSLAGISDGIKTNYVIENGIPISQSSIDTQTSLGYNIILEDTQTIRNRFLVGVKVFTQPYQNGNINSGIMFKVGAKL